MKKTFGILGCGFLGTIVATAYKRGFLDEYDFIGAYSHNETDINRLLAVAGEGKAFTSVDAIIDAKPDMLIETASVAFFKSMAVQALEQGISLIPLSIGSFADKAFYDEAMQTAQANHAKIYIPSGAVGGFDVLQTVSLMAEAGVDHNHPFGRENEVTDHKTEVHTHKNPGPIMGTDLFSDEVISQMKTVFDGTAEEAIEILPTQVNVMVAAALASSGPDQTGAKITTVPGFVGDDHRTVIETHGIRGVIDIYSSTSAIAGWSIVALMRNLASPMEFF